jgi:SAM-dependent methyltransferase
VKHENHFCTLFDVNYLPRGLVLYESLARTCREFTLRVFCMDAETKKILDRMQLPSLHAIALEELEAHDPELLTVKPTRTQVEYCWTATPAVALYALEREPELDLITYLDADLMFFRDPAPIFAEFDDESVLIVPHRYSPKWQAWEETSGTYNVQFLTFRRDQRGLEALHWWHDRCIEWCYHRFEDGKLGDQKYLDDWPERFEGVHVLQHQGGGLAPWNVENYELRSGDGSVLVDGLPLVFYHYHSLRLYSGVTVLRSLGFATNTYRLTRSRTPLVWASGYPISEPERRLIWDPYLRRLGAVVSRVRQLEPGFEAGFIHVDGMHFAREGAARRVRRASWRLRGALARILGRRPRPGADYTGSWQDDAVARQMSALTDQELQKAETVPPFRAFVEVITALVEDFPLVDPASFLDFGCGVGHYSVLLDRYFPDRFVYTGCDYAPAMVNVARDRRLGKTFVVNDLFDNHLDLDAFDVISAGALVDVLSDYERALHLLLGAGAPYVVLHRQRMTEGPSRVEEAPGYEGQTTYRSFLSRSDLERIANQHGREIRRVVDVDDGIQTFLMAKSRL